MTLPIGSANRRSIHTAICGHTRHLREKFKIRHCLNTGLCKQDASLLITEIFYVLGINYSMQNLGSSCHNLFFKHDYNTMYILYFVDYIH